MHILDFTRPKVGSKKYPLGAIYKIIEIVGMANLTNDNIPDIIVRVSNGCEEFLVALPECDDDFIFQAEHEIQIDMYELDFVKTYIELFEVEDVKEYALVGYPKPGVEMPERIRGIIKI